MAGGMGFVLGGAFGLFMSSVRILEAEGVIAFLQLILT